MNNIFNDFVIGTELFVGEDDWTDIVNNNSKSLLYNRFQTQFVILKLVYLIARLHWMKLIMNIGHFVIRRTYYKKVNG